MMICDQVINWLQVETVAMLMCNLFLGGVCAACIYEVRRLREKAQ